MLIVLCENCEQCGGAEKENSISSFKSNKKLPKLWNLKLLYRQQKVI